MNDAHGGLPSLRLGDHEHSIRSTRQSVEAYGVAARRPIGLAGAGGAAVARGDEGSVD